MGSGAGQDRIAFARPLFQRRNAYKKDVEEGNSYIKRTATSPCTNRGPAVEEYKGEGREWGESRVPWRSVALSASTFPFRRWHHFHHGIRIHNYFSPRGLTCISY